MDICSQLSLGFPHKNLLNASLKVILKFKLYYSFIMKFIFKISIKFIFKNSIPQVMTVKINIYSSF